MAVEVLKERGAGVQLERNGGRTGIEMPGPGAEKQVEPRDFRGLSQVMVTAWRLGLGRTINRFPRQVGRVLVLTTVGRKSGMDRRTPLNYAPGGGGCVYVLAGVAGTSDWFRNLEVNPRCEVWLPDGHWEVRAVPVAESRERLLRIREVLQNSGLASEQPAGIDPFTMSDELLRAKTAEYRVMRLDLERRLHGPTPNDLAWVWPLAGLGVLAGLTLWGGLSRRLRQD